LATSTQQTGIIFITNISGLCSLGKEFIFILRITKRHKYPEREKYIFFFKIKAGGTYSYHFTLKFYLWYRQYSNIVARLLRWSLGPAAKIFWFENLVEGIFENRCATGYF
jgi:hypothetical protein